jgi:hypothetical protein
MSRLLSRRALDARWPWHHRSVPIGHMNAVCEVFRRSGDVNDYGWDPETGSLSHQADPGNPDSWPFMTLLYRGPTRGANNKDWRARTRTTHGDSGTVHAVRFQVPQRTCPPIHAHDILRVLSAPPDQEMTHYIFHVRNMMMSSNMWARDLLCDVDVAHAQLLPPPNQGEPVSADQIPEPLMGGCGCSG